MLPEPIVTTRATIALVLSLPRRALNPSKASAKSQKGKSPVVGLPGVIIPHTTPVEKADSASGATPAAPLAPSTAEVVTKSNEVVKEVAPIDNSTVRLAQPGAVVDDVVENVRQLLDPLSHADRCRVMGIDASERDRSVTTAAALGEVYNPIPLRSTLARDSLKKDAPISREPLAAESRAVERTTVVRSYSPVSGTSLEESDTDGDEIYAQILHEAEFRAAARSKQTNENSHAERRSDGSASVCSFNQRKRGP